MRPDVAAYANYDAPIRDMPGDTADIVVIAPETYIGVLKRFKFAKRCIWWLSIDDSPHFFFRKRWMTGQILERKTAVRAWQLSTNCDMRSTARFVSRCYNFTQSDYAWNHLYARFGVLPTMLSDFTSAEGQPDHEWAPRAKRIAYNPAKGGAFVERIAARRPDLEWVPIQGMSKGDVTTLLRSAAVYLDLGHHPGKDRLPREAAVNGAIVVVSRRGSAAIHADVPIPWRFKLDLTPDLDVDDASARLDAILGDQVTAHREQQELRHSVVRERAQFRAEVKNIFLENQAGHWLRR